ncbi:uncharacterized protein SCHCODRAFT_02624461 [Schizophyllum commune H4-8]|uniref:uncharacterized protein n=1 Tax=Schizophyllum commune (strain H4-8 / FGSC 9210) TaxID=578458 RepID=UPI002160872F|nr:uncharacterized protein SCHCODRAFT_02624461 [Schizophyllum commune H4-8]KAI5894368.1 hypothetical protein SCHCODRAFT_02624461 [Schizophyllum commune H4-8]
MTPRPLRQAPHPSQLALCVYTTPFSFPIAFPALAIPRGKIRQAHKVVPDLQATPLDDS